MQCIQDMYGFRAPNFWVTPWKSQVEAAQMIKNIQRPSLPPKKKLQRLWSFVWFFAPLLTNVGLCFLCFTTWPIPKAQLQGVCRREPDGQEEMIGQCTMNVQSEEHHDPWATLKSLSFSSVAKKPKCVSKPWFFFSTLKKTHKDRDWITPMYIYAKRI